MNFITFPFTDKRNNLHFVLTHFLFFKAFKAYLTCYLINPDQELSGIRTEYQLETGRKT